MINATLFESSDWLVNHKLPYQYISYLYQQIITTITEVTTMSNTIQLLPRPIHPSVYEVESVCVLSDWIPELFEQNDDNLDYIDFINDGHYPYYGDEEGDIEHHLTHYANYYLYHHPENGYDVLAYRGMLTLDVDSKDPLLKRKLYDIMQSLSHKYTFMVYETMRGYHIMIVNKFIIYSRASYRFMYIDSDGFTDCENELTPLIELTDTKYIDRCKKDFYYGLRVSPKYSNDYVAKYKCTIGRSNYIPKDIDVALNKYNELISRYH